MLEAALKSKEGGREEVARLQSLFRPPLDLKDEEMKMLRKQNANLEDEKERIAHYAKISRKELETSKRKQHPSPSMSVSANACTKTLSNL